LQQYKPSTLVGNIPPFCKTHKSKILKFPIVVFEHQKHVKMLKFAESFVKQNTKNDCAKIAKHHNWQKNMMQGNQPFIYTLNVT